jgi:small-conductance mechanosensitive channel
VFRHRRREDLGELLGGFVRWSLILFGCLVVATIIFPSISPANLLSTLGIGSIAIGFAFKDILQNWVSGLLILYREPFRQGDQIVSGSFEGTVEHVEARATILRTYDGQRVVIPNSDIYTRAVTVRTAFPVRRTDYEVGIGYADDIDTACRVMLEAVRGIDGVKQDPAPDAIPWALDASTVNIKLRWWTDSKRSRGQPAATAADQPRGGGSTRPRIRGAAAIFHWKGPKALTVPVAEAARSDGG